MATEHDFLSSASFPEVEPGRLSVLHGPIDPPLIDLTLGETLDLQCQHYSARECLIFPWTGARWTYGHLSLQSSLLAKALLGMGIEAGDRVGIMAGNCEQYAAVLFAVARIGAILVILNNTYTKEEAIYGLRFTECKVFFTTKRIGRLDNEPLLRELGKWPGSTLEVVILQGEGVGQHRTYDDLVLTGGKSRINLASIEAQVLPHQVVNLQFTSGTTGHPKAAMLTHHNLVNNSRFIGNRMRLSPNDILCCPPPLFHCFGLVLGVLAVLTHGGKIVFPAETFDAPATIRAISNEGCTALHGVPTMFSTLFSLPVPEGWSCERLKKGIVAGAPVPRPLMELMVGKWGMDEFTSSYGLTEASPTLFNAFTDDSLEKRLTTVGTLMPHAAAKIVDAEGNVVPLGQRGELCVAGYQIQAGYWNNSAKTAEVMRPDREGVVWLHTGDEAVFDEDGYCSITGRFKDIIIKGGENVYPAEIEERLVEHPGIERAIVVGVKDQRYGEVVAAFLGRDTGNGEGPGLKLNDEQVRHWVRSKLGRHKAPSHVFWLGEDGVPVDVPLTGSGKVKKFEVARLGEELLKTRRAKL